MYERVLCFRLVFSLSSDARRHSHLVRARGHETVTLYGVWSCYGAALARLTNPFGAWDLARAQFRARPPHAGALLTRQRRTSTIPASASHRPPRDRSQRRARLHVPGACFSKKARATRAPRWRRLRARVLFPRAPARRGDRPAAAERAPTCGFHPRNRPSSLNVPRARIEDEHPRA